MAKSNINSKPKLTAVDSATNREDSPDRLHIRFRPTWQQHYLSGDEISVSDLCGALNYFFGQMRSLTIAMLESSRDGDMAETGFELTQLLCDQICDAHSLLEQFSRDAGIDSAAEVQP